MSDGWCPFAIRCDGPPEKTGYSGRDKTHAKVGVTLHTAEYESTPEWDDYKTLHNALFSDREASWTFTACEFMGGALLFQHYAVGSVCWAQGYQGNLWLDSIETERLAPHKLTEPQYALLVKTLQWIKEEHGWHGEWIVGTRSTQWEGYTRWVDFPDAGSLLFEHNAVPGAPATDCAVFTRGMIDPQRLLRDLREEDMLSAEDERQVETIVLDQLTDPRGPFALEQAARGAVAHAAFGAVLTVLTGHWENLKANVAAIQAEATKWHRWPE